MPTQTTADPHETPRDLEAEAAVLGSLLIDHEAIDRLPFLSGRDFYRSTHRIIFEAMQSLAARGLDGDFRTLSSELERQGKLEDVGGASYVVELVQSCATATHVVYYARRVEHCAVCRRAIVAAGRIAELAYQQPDDLDGMLTDAESLLYEIRRGRESGRVLAPSERASQAHERYERRAAGERPGIPYGLLAFDKWTQGAEAGQFIVIAGRPGMGKSSLLQNIAENMARNGRRVLFATAEMPESQITDRAVSSRMGVSIHHLQEGHYGDETWQGITSALAAMAEEPFYVYDAADMTTAALRSAAVEMRGRFGLDAVFVDYLQILHDRAGRGGEVERVTGISRALKALARSLSVPVITASQLSRAVESRQGNKPQLSDLRESGSIEQDADLVAMLYRPGYYSGDAADNKAELIIAKQRNGPSGITSPLLFDRRLTRFVDGDMERRNDGY